MPIVYERTFRFSASHFNSLPAYQAAWKIAEKQVISVEQQFMAMHQIHGHNFRVVVTISGEIEEGAWLIDDVRLEKCVMEWNNQNLSLHPDFLDTLDRATTENMARVLKAKLTKLIDNEDVHVRQVTVFETDDIFART